MTLQSRMKEPDDGKSFLVDTPNSIDDYIPDDVEQTMERTSHIVNATLPFDKNTSIIKYEETIQKLNRYREEALLVVTGRLHCASPCIAMGIPVIITKNNKDINMGWIERFIQIYTPESFSNIDWHPQGASNEVLKSKMRESAKKMIETTTFNMLHYDLSYEFESTIDDSYNRSLVKKLNRIAKRIGKMDFRFAIWGLGDGGSIAYRLIKEQYPDSKCVIGIDSFKEGSFYDLKIKKPKELEGCLSSIDYIFLTTYSGRKEAVEYLTSLKLYKDKHYSFLLSRVNGEDEFFQI